MRAKDDCASLLFAIGMQQRVIDEGRRVLSPDEASCAFVDFTMPVTGDCARQGRRNADVKKRQAWTSAMVAWVNSTSCGCSCAASRIGAAALVQSDEALTQFDGR
jgi:hypothetical protein